MRVDVVCVNDVSFAYDTRQALAQYHAAREEGVDAGIIGQWRGKSTVLKLIGVLKADEGEITILGRAPLAACAGRGAGAMCRSGMCWIGRFRSQCGRWCCWG